jgi:hypothetical protein
LPGIHLNVYPGVPPETVTDALPSAWLQCAFVTNVLSVIEAGSLMVMNAVFVHPFESEVSTE